MRNLTQELPFDFLSFLQQRSSLDAGTLAALLGDKLLHYEPGTRAQKRIASSASSGAPSRLESQHEPTLFARESGLLAR